MNFAALLKSKTFWTGVTGLLASIGGYLSNNLDLMNAIYGALGSLAVIFGRDKLESLGTLFENIKNFQDQDSSAGH